MHAWSDSSEVMTPRRNRSTPARTRCCVDHPKQSVANTMLREPVKIRKSTRSVRVTEEIAAHLEISTGVRPDIDSLTRVTYHTIGREKILATQPIRLEVNSETMGEAFTSRKLYTLLKAVPDLVSDEEKRIDFDSSVSQEEHMDKEAGPSVVPTAPATLAPEEPTPTVVGLTEVTIPEQPKISGAKTIGPKRTGPRSTGASSTGSKPPGSRGRPVANMELDELLESALKEHDLQGFTPLLVKARMTSVRYLSGRCRWRQPAQLTKGGVHAALECDLQQA